MYHQTIILSTKNTSLELSRVAEAISHLLPADFQFTSYNPDIKEISRSKSSIGIADIQPLISWNGQKPFQGENKVGIIYDAERLTPEAQNSLLKTLEEPTPGTLICLVTRNSNALLPTVLSRSQIINIEGEKRDSAEKNEQFAIDFLKADLIFKSQMIAQIADAEESREEASNFVLALMHELVSQRSKYSLTKLNQYLDVCRLAFQGLKSGTNIKLTLETIVISMS
jgi:hypothetical protein